MLKCIMPGLVGLLLITGAATTAQAQSCTTIGSSTFCGARGSHNTVGNTMIFNTGRAGQRIGNFGVVGTPSRTFTVPRSGRNSLVATRTFSGVATPKSFGSARTYEARIAQLRAEILAIEAQNQLQQLSLTPAQEAAKTSMPPALIRALKLAQQGRNKAAAEAGGSPLTID